MINGLKGLDELCQEKEELSFQSSACSWFIINIRATKYSCAGCALHRTPHPCLVTLLPRGQQQLTSSVLSTRQPMPASRQVCLLGEGVTFSLHRFYPLVKPCSLGTAPPRGGRRGLFLNLIKMPCRFTATLAKFLLAATDAFTPLSCLKSRYIIIRERVGEAQKRQQ